MNHLSGVLGALAVAVAVAVAFSPQPHAAAAVGAAPAPCLTLAADLQSIRGMEIQAIVHRGAAATALVAVMIELSGPPPVDLSPTTAVLILVGSPAAEPPVVIRFYRGGEQCVFYAAATGREGLATLLSKYGTGA